MSAFWRSDLQSSVREDVEDAWRAGSLAENLPAFDASMTCAEIYEHFHLPNAQIAAAVVDEENRVVGIVNRLRFLARYAQRYVPELFGKQSILKLANSAPLIVDEHMTVADLGAMITLDRPDALRECFVVTRGDRYLGIGTSEALVRAKVALLTSREELLRSALARAEDASRTKSNFLALMSHELRTPLNAIIGFSEVLSSELFGPHGSPRYLEYSGDINGAGKHLLALINDILDLSKSEAGRLELYQEPVDLEALFRNCVRLVNERAREQNLKISIDVAPGTPCLYADELRMKQVILNLLSNAVKFTPQGGHVTLSASCAGSRSFVIAVADTGIGMAPETIPIALEPFRQIATPLSRTIEGTGLGLSLVKSLTEQQGGTISIESLPNKGTTVRLSFPPELVRELPPARKAG
jgi:two-component system cell cycle sensor histidine kinase PleC